MPVARRILAERAGVLLAVGVIAALALGRLWWLPAHASLSVNEGWNATQAVRALGAGPLYPAPDALIANNYPPLSFFLVGWLGRAAGDLILTGRMLALAGQVATGIAACMVVMRLSPGGRRVALAGVLFGGFSVTLLRPYLGMNDPQWLGHAAMSWAIVILLPPIGERRSAGRIVAAAALVVVGGLIKHNLVAFPLAVTLWLWITDRRSATLWIATVASFAAAAAAGLYAIWGEAVFVDVLAPARSYSLLRMTIKGGPLLLALLPVLLAIRPLRRAARDDPRLLLPVLLLAVALPIGIVQRAGSGVVVNAFFEAIVAASIAGPVALAHRRSADAWAAIMLLPILSLVPAAAIDDLRELRGRDAAVARTAPFVSAIASAEGPVACDDQAVCYWAGRDSAIDFFSVNQRLLQGGADALAPALDRGDFALIQMRAENPGWRENKLLPTIHARYRVLYREGDAELLAPARGYKATSAFNRSRRSGSSATRRRA